ncbi:mitochondrial PGP phosphatase [Polychytrium aggregatum]|uniref:mitochondrial PGP phosphatase n=1 Tax=Polychytrium aggregatum TaxID=110093 RepID=UPI0022FE3092|nr:mitochondrial PGP phosphatase [Polychytrium aggregatum]KAI9197162.1 mitochondrial PGP phosphatase [Polychytrium aggregatum]
MVQSLNLAGIATAFRVLARPSLVVPNIVVDDLRSINFKDLKDERGIRAIAFDKDNTLTAPYQNEIHPPFQDAWNTCKEVFGKHRIVIVSNSAGTPDDVGSREAERVEAALGVHVLRHRIKKPLGGEELTQHLGLPPSQIAVVGDRLLTDVVFGNLNGNLTILTRKIVTTQGDNRLAAMIRRAEHWLIDWLQARGR